MGALDNTGISMGDAVSDDQQSAQDGRHSPTLERLEDQLA